MPRRLKLVLQRPHPHLLCQQHGWHYLFTSVLIFGVLIDLFMCLSLNTWNEHHKWMILPGFGMSYAFSYWLSSVLLRQYIPFFSNTGVWTVEKEFFLLLIFIPFMLVFSWLYSLLTFSLEDLKLFNMLYFLKFNFISSGVMMVSLTSFSGLKFKTPPSQPTESRVEKSVEKPKLLSVAGIFELKKQKYKTEEIIYVESKRNNIIMHQWLKQAHETKNIYYPIGQFEQLVSEFPQLVRCHGSYIVNLDMVLSAEYSDNQLNLTLVGLDKPVSVSTNYSKEITELLFERSIYVK